MASYPFYRASAAQAQALGATPHLPQANIGLWFTRFYDGFKVPDWKIDDGSKSNFIATTVALARDQSSVGKEQISQLAQRQLALCRALGGESRALTTSAPLLTGSGLSHPVENGFTFHPTLGMPYLPASGIKGMLRGWIEQWADLSADERQRLATHWFGPARGDDRDLGDAQDSDQAGALIFFDALPLGWMQLRCDILTPHMGKWYECGADLDQASFAQAAPGDWYSPVPSPFLVVERGARFQFSIAPRCTGDAQHDALARAAVGEAMRALVQALEWTGFGAKTAAGYGRLYDSEQANTQALLESNIALGKEEWDNTAVSWNKGKVELSVVQGPKERCTLTQQAARDMRQSLAQADQNALDKGKTIRAKAQVERQGNQYRLLSLSSLPR